MSVEQLFVIWRATANGGRHVIGRLARSPRRDEVRFWYEDDLSGASAAGFRLLPMFPEHRCAADPYVARYLFPAFAERIPSPARSDAKGMLAAWGVRDADDQFEILARSGGLRATDRLELAEYRDADDELLDPLEFRIAGIDYIERPAVLSAGQRLVLVREPENTADRCATLLLAHSGERAGYVPRQYSGMVARLLDAGVSLEAEAVRELAIPEVVGRWVVEVRRG